MIERARTNVAAAIPDPANLVLKQGDVYEGFEERGLDRVVLDLPEPWRVVPHAASAPGAGRDIPGASSPPCSRYTTWRWRWRRTAGST